MLTRKRYGLDKVSYEIEGLLLSSKYLAGKLYIPYMSLFEEDKKGFKREVENIVKEYLVSGEFFKALSKDIIEVNKDNTGKEYYTYHTESEVYKYIRKVYYRGQSKKLLQDLLNVR